MANYSILKAAVEAVVKTNGNEEITGANLQSTLESIIDSLGADYQFVGVATPSTSPGTPDQNVFYIGAAGTYSNFGADYTVPVGCVGLFSYNGSWGKDSFEVFNENTIDNIVEGITETIGYNDSATYQDISNTVVCPVRKVAKDGLLKKIKIQSENAGQISVYTGYVNQSYYFVMRREYKIDVQAGEQTIDVSDYNIYVYAGEQIAVLFNGKRYYAVEYGSPEDEYSFYYSNTAYSFQLQKFGNENQRIVFNVQYEILEGALPSAIADVVEDVLQNKERINKATTGIICTSSIGNLSSSQNMMKDAVISAAYYDKESNLNPYIRLAGYYDWVQITLTYDHNTNMDFKEDASERPTGVKTYLFEDGSKKFIITIDWDVLTSNYNDTTSSIFCIENKEFKYVTCPLFDKDVLPLQQIVNGQTEIIGCNDTTRYQELANTVVCPVRKVAKSGRITSVYVKSENEGNVTLYVGEVDQLYLFVAREQHELYVQEGDNIIDTSSMDIFALAGEQVAIKFNGNRYWDMENGLPEDEESFYYSNDPNSLQLQVFDNPSMRLLFAFQYTVVESELTELEAEVYENRKAIEAINSEIGYVKSNMNIIPDRNGNKYRMVVVDGQVTPFIMEFSHLMAVGNSYTIHPTVTDTEPDYANNLWWGHWSMAATRKETAWTTLLQTALRQKQSSAVVTPVFGRRYETGLRSLTDNDAFTYYDGSEWQNLKPNVSSFSDVDCVLFFLGDNYTSGGDWYSLYKPMVEQFVTWFPNATIVCCSTRSRPANNEAISLVASEEAAIYVSMYGLGGASKIGSYVSSDDSVLHQINNTAVANHFGDLGQWLILNKITEAIGYDNNATLYDISITNSTGVTLSVKDTKTIEGSIVSVFANISGVTLNSITVMNGSSSISVTDHGSTDYGRIFTFIMPAGNVTITANTQ